MSIPRTRSWRTARSSISLASWPISRILRGKVLRDCELSIRRREGDWQRIFSYGGRLARDANGHPLLALLTVNDITERKQAQDEVQQLNEGLRRTVARLEEANVELQAFSYSVSHDLRAPLRAIDGYASILTEDYSAVLGADGQRLLDIVRTQARRMGGLVDDLLAFSRLSRQAMHSVDVDMNEVAQAAFEECAAQATGRCLKLTLRPLPRAHGDRAMLRRVLVNLLSNAIKFTRPRPVAEIEIDGRADGAERVFRVTDNGVGFDMRYAGKLFGVFQRLHAENEFAGTGVGLAPVQRIVQRHGGRVWAEAAPERGASFSFALPLKSDTYEHT